MSKTDMLKLFILAGISTQLIVSHHNSNQLVPTTKNSSKIEIKTSEQRLNEFMQYANKVKVESDALEKKKRQEEQKVKEDDGEYINLICTFYTGSADENGGSQNTNKTANGKNLSRGMIASNAHKFGTKIYTEEFGVLTVEDRGNPKYIRKINENTYRIDIYVPDKKTAETLGVKKIKGKIVH